jgi:hypothetical protein
LVRRLPIISVFSLGPLLLIVTAVAGLFFGADAVRGSLTAQFRGMLGETGSQAVEAMLKGASSSTAGGWSAAVGIALLLLAALGVVVQLKDALNTIFEVKERGRRRDRLARARLHGFLRRHPRAWLPALGIACHQHRPCRLARSLAGRFYHRVAVECYAGPVWSWRKLRFVLEPAR